MALQDILKKIEDEAKKKAAFIKQVADDEIKKIREEAQAKADARRVEIEQKTEAQSSAVVEKSKTLAAMEGRSQALKQKREVIDQAYEEVESALDALSDDDYVSFLSDIMKHAQKTIEKGALVVPANRLQLTKDAIQKANADFEIESETHDFKGGFVLMSGKVEINLSFPYLVQKIVRPATELEVAKILFS